MTKGNQATLGSERFKAVNDMYDAIMQQSPNDCAAALKTLHSQGGNGAFIASVSASATQLINSQVV